MSRKATLNALFGMKPGAGAPEVKSAGGREAALLGAPNTPAPEPVIDHAIDPASVPAAPPAPALDLAPALALAFAPALAHDVALPSTRVRSGAIGAMGASLQKMGDEAREVEALRATLLAAEQVLELDPGLIDPAPVSDRLMLENDPASATLQASIAESGQQVPVLVRLHPARPGRYQVAYGHRRIRACAALGRPVKAVIRALSDAELAVAQGQENLARRDLSFIEKALFAQGLEQAQLDRATIIQALATDKADLSRYLGVARAIPLELARAIGPAPKAGRARWLALSDALARALAKPAPADRPGHLPARIEATLEKAAFQSAESDARFSQVLAALQAHGAAAAPAADAPAVLVSAPDGKSIIAMEARGNRMLIALNEAEAPGFAAHLASRLPELYRLWHQGRGGNSPTSRMPKTDTRHPIDPTE